MAVGFLVFPMRVTLAFLLTEKMQAAGKYDHIMREPVLSDADADGLSDTTREEAEITLDGQVATYTNQRMEQRAAGQVLETRDKEITFHRNDLEEMGLLFADGSARIQTSVRLAKIETPHCEPIQAWTKEPFLYVTASRFSGFFGALLVVTFSDRREELGEREPLQK